LGSSYAVTQGGCLFFSDPTIIKACALTSACSISYCATEQHVINTVYSVCAQWQGCISKYNLCLLVCSDGLLQINRYRTLSEDLCLYKFHIKKQNIHTSYILVTGEHELIGRFWHKTQKVIIMPDLFWTLGFQKWIMSHFTWKITSLPSGDADIRKQLRAERSMLCQKWLSEFVLEFQLKKRCPEIWCVCVCRCVVFIFVCMYVWFKVLVSSPVTLAAWLYKPERPRLFLPVFSCFRK